VATDGIEGYPSREDRIVAEFGDGLDVQGIAFRYGLDVAQVYAVIERELGPAEQGPPSQCPPPNQFPPPGYQAPANVYAPPPAGPQGHYPPPPGQGPYGPQMPPPAPVYAAPYQPFQPSLSPQDEDAVVAEYGEGHDVEWIARKHGINADRVYEVVQRIVQDDPQAGG
jgi:Mor family transcriptional regulator